MTHTPEEWSAIWAFVGVLITLGAVVVALSQLSIYLQELRERARPFVIVDFDFRGQLLMVRVQNASPTMAANVRLESDPPFSSTWSPLGNEGLARVMKDGIPQLSPGRSIAWSIDSAPTYWDSDHPRMYNVTATYEDPRTALRPWWKFWAKRAPVQYVEPFVLDIRQWDEAAVEFEPDAQIVSAIKDLTRTVKGRLGR